jgi:hypothetical protein
MSQTCKLFDFTGLGLSFSSCGQHALKKKSEIPHRPLFFLLRFQIQLLELNKCLRDWMLGSAGLAVGEPSRKGGKEGRLGR